MSALCFINATHTKLAPRSAEFCSMYKLSLLNKSCLCLFCSLPFTSFSQEEGHKVMQGAKTMFLSTENSVGPLSPFAIGGEHQLPT